MPHQKVWSRFETKNKDGMVIKLRIQDLPDDRLDDFLDFGEEYLCCQEAVYIAAGMNKNPAALKERRMITQQRFKKDNRSKFHPVICCLDDSEAVGNILGISAMAIVTRGETINYDDLLAKIQTAEYKKFYEILKLLDDAFDVMENLHLDKFFDDRGIAVHPDYKGLGIATEFLKTRLQICKEFGVCVTSSSLTAVGSQRAAEKAGWQTGCHVPVSAIEERVGCKFQGAPEFIKIMFAMVEL